VDVVAADRELGNDGEPALLDDVDVVVKSGGVPNEAPLVAGALARRIPIWSDAEVGYRILPNPLVGVTGTNGKTTTTALLAEMLGAPAAGNIGLALCALDGEVEPERPIVCELSSFQLEYVDAFRPRVAVLLNLEPDHLDRHGTFEAYRAAKLRVFENQRADDVAVLPRGFERVPGAARRVEFTAGDPLPAEPLLRGRHNRENAAAATAAARALGVADEDIARGLAMFRGVEHRLEVVGDIGRVTFVNDSKATNVGATLRALEAYADRQVHLILGGRGKGQEFRPLAEAIGANVARAYLIGEAAPELDAALRGRVDLVQCETLERALGAASAAAEPGDVVLLSPACASFDQFRDFEHRGDEFKQLVARRSARTPVGGDASAPT
jgi:UDP-N-acetylmuramoylalanine--D-glutamate ligase